DGIRDSSVTGVQTCALPISAKGIKQLKKGVQAAQAASQKVLQSGVASKLAKGTTQNGRVINVIKNGDAAPMAVGKASSGVSQLRSEERRVGKEWTIRSSM